MIGFNEISMNSAAWLLVFARMGGLLGRNPLFARRNVPAPVRAGLTFLLTALIAPGITVTGLAAENSLELAVGMVGELLVGFCCGYVFQIFYYMLFFAGIFFFQAGLHKLLLYIFCTDSHLLLIRIFADSFQVLPAGAFSFSQESARFFIDLFVSTFSLALRLVLPFMAAEFVLELSMGVLMKLIPQIHIFVINIQFKMILGMILLLAFSSPVASFTDNYMRLMMENLQYAFSALAGAPG